MKIPLFFVIPNVSTVYLFGEESTDGHHPMKFECSDGGIYYCKYRISMKKEELDFLTYEVVAHFLMKALQISTPEIGLVTLNKDSFDKNDLKYNKKYAKPGIVCFGSKEVKGASLISGAQLIKRKKEFNRYENGIDLIKIAAFDLWLHNTDRGRDDNMNILEAPSLVKEDKLRYYAIDNAFILGNVEGLRIFHPADEIKLSSKLIHNQYFTSAVAFIPKVKRMECLQKFLNLYKKGYNEALNQAFSCLPDSWEVPELLKNKIIDFVSNEKRMDKVIALTAQKLESI